MTLESEVALPESAAMPTIIRVQNASKRFVIRKDKSVKERIVNFGRGKQHRDYFWALRDIQFLVEVGLLIFFWLSPITYAWSFVVDTVPGWLEQIYLLNPMTNAMLAFQRAIWGPGSRETQVEQADGSFNTVAGQPWPADMALHLFLVFLVGLVLVWVSHRIFRRLEGNFAQEI